MYSNLSNVLVNYLEKYFLPKESENPIKNADKWAR